MVVFSIYFYEIFSLLFKFFCKLSNQITGFDGNCTFINSVKFWVNTNVKFTASVQGL